ncbi:tyrosine-protein phosphatase [Ponticoccus sp. SC2-23]|uniref:tyrosine-protein phosphatase n=1 Tax=Alexandriicola marinus TaxID=2081710 RepID=UPI000FD70651|nr:tyrosine-protein phosphatase [Alexandriicola marinus]MBM1221632.1 tyrosine-protein phosphatase [Ponticoccus sp. SC6-9]MBM1226673.1 tyrosine-protein phosphatase [Ponticoccus sp. SC6-15]MBM1230624.1 tyrosine-protein phosphatase [Ponticoccus sp. SC6-38]MBM1235147.1 tyrosine-protein phosphatase [Ponticoccus sp. SC6-45]MBM1239645.1 tyrosine-protein phosphatase [Ponticoccus sp. SC6-49]MBM1243427.1 tyrosine-protein phosphatase [Ponticoccus sp. SC2-64]MBM1248671.1 tyrosine-protein phosphatase [Po
MEKTDPQITEFTLKERMRYLFVDHAVLRYRWHNFHEIAPGVFRSNQPTHGRLAAYRAMGIENVITLRGSGNAIHQRMERASCDALDITMFTIRANARKPISRDELVKLLDLFRTVPRPFLMHCKSGADRAGLASALYLLDQEDASVEEARGMLSFRYLHIKHSATGILDHILDRFEARQADGPISIRDWIETEYSVDDISRSWAADRRG